MHHEYDPSLFMLANPVKVSRSRLNSTPSRMSSNADSDLPPPFRSSSNKDASSKLRAAADTEERDRDRDDDRDRDEQPHSRVHTRSGIFDDSAERQFYERHNTDYDDPPNDRSHDDRPKRDRNRWEASKASPDRRESSSESGRRDYRRESDRRESGRLESSSVRRPGSGCSNELREDGYERCNQRENGRPDRRESLEEDRSEDRHRESLDRRDDRHCDRDRASSSSSSQRAATTNSGHRGHSESDNRQHEMTRYAGSSSQSSTARHSSAPASSSLRNVPEQSKTIPSGSRPSVDAASSRPRVFGPSQHMASRKFFATPLGDYDQGDLDRDHDDDKPKGGSSSNNSNGANLDGADGVYSQKGASKLSKRDLENLRLAQMFKAKKFDIPEYNLHSNMDEVAYDVTRIQQELAVRELVQRDKNRYLAITTGLEGILSFLMPSLPITQIRQDIEAALNEQEFNMEKKYWSGPPPTVNHSPKDFLMALFLPVAYRLIETYQKNREQQRQQQMQQQRDAAFQSYMYGGAGAYGFPPYMPEAGMPGGASNVDPNAAPTGANTTRNRKTFTRKQQGEGGSTDWFGPVLSMVTKLFGGGSRSTATDDETEYLNKSAPANPVDQNVPGSAMYMEGGAPWSVPPAPPTSSFAAGAGTGFASDPLFGSGPFASGSMDPALATPFDFSMFDGSGGASSSFLGDDALAFSAFDSMFGTDGFQAPASDLYGHGAAHMTAPPTPAPAQPRPTMPTTAPSQQPARSAAPPTPSRAPGPTACAKAPAASTASHASGPAPESKLPSAATAKPAGPPVTEKIQPPASSASPPSAAPTSLPAASPGQPARRRANLAPPPFVPAPASISNSSGSVPPQTPRNKPLAVL